MKNPGATSPTAPTSNMINIIAMIIMNGAEIKKVPNYIIIAI